MINYLTGKIKNLNEKYLTVLTASGVGYKVFAPINTLLSKSQEEEIELFIYTSVKEDAIDLYGFEKKEELSIFEKLITASGVGPRSALTMISLSSVESIAFAIENGDEAALSHIPGIGKKTREKIIIELKGKMSEFIKSNENSNINNFSNEKDARLALSTFGYNDKDINNAINNIKSEENIKFNELSASEIIKLGLKFLR